MVLRLPVLLLAVLFSAQAQAEQSRTVPLAMTVAVLDVAKSHCRGRLAVNLSLEARLLHEFHQFDVGGIQSLISPPLNSFYEEFLNAAKADRSGFCAQGPGIAARGGWPGLLIARRVRFKP